MVNIIEDYIGHVLPSTCPIEYNENTSRGIEHMEYNFDDLNFTPLNESYMERVTRNFKAFPNAYTFDMKIPYNNVSLVYGVRIQPFPWFLKEKEFEEDFKGNLVSNLPQKGRILLRLRCVEFSMDGLVYVASNLDQATVMKQFDGGVYNDE